MTDLTNKVALITSSARGIGKDIAERYASLGADIIINYIRDDIAANATVENIKKMGRKAVAVQCDISKTIEFKNLFETTKEFFDKIDIVVINATIELVNFPITKLKETQYDHFFNIKNKNAFANALHIAARNVSNNGRIIFVNSDTINYSKSKYSKTYLEYQINILAQELWKRGITINSILANTESEFKKEFQGIFRIVEQFITDFCPIRSCLSNSNEDIADVAEFFASSLSSFVNGQEIFLSRVMHSSNTSELII